LFRMSVLGAARICNANAFQLKSLSEYARSFGLVFQVADDIADAGTKSDEPSFVKVVGLDAARSTCQQLVARAQAAVDPLGEGAHGLKQLVQYLYERTNE
jgi:farnesyl diphosphate synthase